MLCNFSGHDDLLFAWIPCESGLPVGSGYDQKEDTDKVASYGVIRTLLANNGRFAKEVEVRVDY